MSETNETKNTATETTAQNRWKSPIVWSAIISGILSILVASGVFTSGQQTAYTTAVSFVLQALVGFGILNNPTDSTGF